MVVVVLVWVVVVMLGRVVDVLVVELVVTHADRSTWQPTQSAHGESRLGTATLAAQIVAAWPGAGCGQSQTSPHSG